jgi:hypothetical protein
MERRNALLELLFESLSQSTCTRRGRVVWVKVAYRSLELFHGRLIVGGRCSRRSSSLDRVESLANGCEQIL